MTEMFQNAAMLSVGFFALSLVLVGAGLISIGLFTVQRNRVNGFWLVCFGLLCWNVPVGIGFSAGISWQAITGILVLSVLTVMMLKSS